MRQRKREGSKKKMKSAREVLSDETVHEARVFETFKCKCGNASDVKSQLFDQRHVCID